MNVDGSKSESVTQLAGSVPYGSGEEVNLEPGVLLQIKVSSSQMCKRMKQKRCPCELHLNSHMAGVIVYYKNCKLAQDMYSYV